MTPKEKAIELVYKFMKYEPIKLSDYTRIEYPSAINLVKICVDEILKAGPKLPNKEGYNYYSIIFWNEVKKELNEL